MEKPKILTVVKVIPHGLLTRTVLAIDDKGQVWQRLEGFGEADWKVFNGVIR